MLADKKRRGRPRKQKALIESDDEDNDSGQQYTSLEAAAPTALSEESMDYQQSNDAGLPFSQDVGITHPHRSVSPDKYKC